jgi:protein AbiQ
MVETDENGKRSLLGTIKLSNMIPVPSNQLIDYELDNEQDVEYKNLIMTGV